MDSLVRAITSHGQYPMVVLYPTLYHEGMTDHDRLAYANKGWQARPFDPRMLDEIRDKHAALRRIAGAHHAGIIDVQGAIATLHGPLRAALFLDEWHLNGAGNRRVAELVADALTDAAEHRPGRATAATP